MRVLTEEIITAFERELRREEKSANTVEKYLRDVRAFFVFVGESEVSKETAIAYKNRLIESRYAPRSINSMLSSVNALFAFLGWMDCRVKAIKLQRQIYCPEEKELTKEEYRRLLDAARQKGNERLDLLVQTICGTGIRVSELRFITVESARKGAATVSLKGKTRTVFLVRELQKKLLRYTKSRGITTGPVFITASGKPLSRTNIWRDMKALCKSAQVDP